MRILVFVIALFAATATLFTPAAMAMRGVHHKAMAAEAIHSAHDAHTASDHHQRHHKRTGAPRDMACAGCMALAAMPVISIGPSSPGAAPDVKTDAGFTGLRALPPLPPPRA